MKIIHFFVLISGIASLIIIVFIFGWIVGCFCGVKNRSETKQQTSHSEEVNTTENEVTAHSDPVYDEVGSPTSSGTGYTHNISYGHVTITTHL